MGEVVIGIGASPHPLPTSPVEGEVPRGGWGDILPETRYGTLPLAGRVGEGDGWPLCQGENYDAR